MRFLLGGPETPTDDDVLDAYPWPSGRWVRAMMVTTLDGAAAGPDGLSGSISSDADRAVFDAVRRLADVVVVGSGTLRAEEYGPMRARAEDAERRAADGQAAAPVLAVVSGSLKLPWGLPVWSESTVRPIVVTGADADTERLATARRHADVVVLESSAVEPGPLLDALEQRGLRRVVCEGGPSLLRDLVAADLVDEADITLSPTFAGTEHTPSTDALPSVAGFALAHVLTADQFLMLRYLAAGR